MPPHPTPSVLADVRGAAQLAVDGVQGVVGIVESVHERIASRAPVVGQVPERRTRGITGLVYGSVRATTSLVGGGLGLGLAGVERLLGPKGPAWGSPRRQTLVAAVNGICGDHLARTGNPLAIPMTLQAAADWQQRPHIIVLVHGLCMTAHQWKAQGHDHGRSLAQACGATPVYASYNTGLHIADNGAAFARQLQALVDGWPVPVSAITLVGHSMGGLVARAAAGQARCDRLPWLAALRHMVFLGTPHHGAPLEQGGQWLHRALGVSPYLAPFTRLAGLRSAGITDLRDGNLLPVAPHARFSRRAGRATVPLPAGVACYAIAGTLGPGLLGDGLVTVDSALGRHRAASRDLRLPADRQHVAQGVGHLALLSDAGVAARVVSWVGQVDATRYAGAGSFEPA
jgi:pimeloyl-ACP methyl ester carboxylesterase